MQGNGVDMRVKEYFKMADEFRDTSQEYMEQLLYSGFMSKDSCELMAHAVSSHDELVAEVERLLGMIDALEKEHENIIANMLDKASALGVCL